MTRGDVDMGGLQATAGIFSSGNLKCPSSGERGDHCVTYVPESYPNTTAVYAPVRLRPTEGSTGLDRAADMFSGSMLWCFTNEC
jgi:hypothetical protein